MASALLPNVLPTWVPGTVVSAYSELVTDSGQPRPIGPALDTAVVDDSGAVAFDSLPSVGEAYVAAAQVGGEWHFRYFAVPGPTNALEEEIVAREKADAELLAAIASKNPLLGYTPENVTNRDVDPLLTANSDTRYPSQKATKAYVDAVMSLLPTFNVKDPRFGAKGDGATDDTGAVQAAIDAAAVVGGVVFFPSGRYIISKTLNWKARVFFDGLHWDVSVIALADGANETMVKTASYGAEGVYGCGARNIGIDGNKAKNINSGGFVLDGQSFRFKDVRVTNVAGHGVDLQISNESQKAVSGLDSVLQLTRAVGCTGRGLSIRAHDTSLLDCQAIQCTEYGVYFGTNGLAVNCHTWCYASDATCTKIGWFLKGSVDCVNCTAEGASEVQVQFSGSNNRWQSGDVFNSAGKPDAVLVEFLPGENFGTHEINAANLHNFGNGAALKFTGNAANSKIRCHIFDPGVEKVAAIGEPATSIVWDVTLGGTTKRGTIPGYHVQRRRTFVPFGGDIPNYTLYVNEAGELRWKDGAGVTKTVQVA